MIKYLPPVIFNLVETAAILLTGHWLLSSWEKSVLLMLIFFVAKFSIKLDMHYKKWYMCMVWSYALFLTLFMVADVDFIISALFAVCTALLISGHSDINDMYLWALKKEKGRGRPKDYPDVIEYVQLNCTDPRLMKFENSLRLDTANSVYHQMYVYAFKHGKKDAEISNIIDIDTQRLSVVGNSLAREIRSAFMTDWSA